MKRNIILYCSVFFSSIGVLFADSDLPRADLPSAPAPKKPPVVTPPATPISKTENSTPEANKKVSAPEENQINESLKKIQELFKSDYTNCRYNVDETLKLARNLTQLAQGAIPKTERKEDVANYYALLWESARFFMQVGHLADSIKSIDFIDSYFLVDKNSLILKLIESEGRPLLPKYPDLFAQELSQILSAFVSQDQFHLGTRSSYLLYQCISRIKDKGQAKIYQNNIAQFKAAKQKYDRIQPMITKLTNNPDDAEANYVVGRYYALNRNDWVQALPYLAKGSNADFKKVAIAESANPTETSQILQIGNEWWELSEKCTPQDRVLIAGHACQLYQQIVDKMSGLDKLHLEKRILNYQESLAKMILRQPGLKPGTLKCQYFEGKFSKCSDMLKAKAIREFDARKIEIPEKVSNDYFGFIYSGYITITQAGQYTFSLNTDDGSMLYINDKEIVNNDGLHALAKKSGTVTLPIGRHKIKIMYIEYCKDALFDIYIQGGPWKKESPIPSSILSQ